MMSLHDFTRLGTRNFDHGDDPDQGNKAENRSDEGQILFEFLFMDV